MAHASDRRGARPHTPSPRGWRWGGTPRGSLFPQNRPRSNAPRAKGDLAIAFDKLHLGPEVGQVVPATRREHGRAVRGVEADKPHSALLAAAHVRTHVEFDESGEPGQRREAAHTHAVHTKRY